jgi:acetyl-CoA carboxylase biotin carboxyl carrier protein
MDFSQIQEIIRMVNKHKISEFSLKEGEFELTIKSQQTAEAIAAPVMISPMPQPVMAMPQPLPVAPPVATTTETAPASAEKALAMPAVETNGNLVSIKSPMVGTFFRSPSPEKPPFIKIGDLVEVGNPVCIIEAMKLFNEIESDVKGKIVKILVEDGRPVEYDQPLFLVEPT